jgi:hypothetical protein
MLSTAPRLGRLNGFSHTIWGSQAVIIAFIVLLVIVDGIWLYASGISLVIGKTAILTPVGLFFAALGAVYTFLRRAPRLAFASLSIAEFVFFVNPGCIFSYAVMTIGRPLVDPILAGWDQMLGFDWVSYVDFFHRHSWFETALSWAYASSFLQIFFVNFVLSMTGRYAAVSRLLANFMIGGIITSIIGAFYPALGGYYHFGIPDHGVSTFIPAIETSRTGLLRVINLDHIEGLVMFPSFHAQTSIALILAAWSIPLLRYPILMLNLLVLLSTPIDGGHYLVDILAGISLAILFDSSWRWLGRWIVSIKAQNIGA